MRATKEQEFLSLSGIQHFAFCRRQWALIHLEQLWIENERTMHGRILHEKAHSGERERRGKLIISRSMPVFSNELGLNGECDVVEWHKNDGGVYIPQYEGTYSPVPIEYKKGKPMNSLANDLQLCAQAMCLEDMLLCHIPVGYLYFHETHRRQEIILTDELRQTVISMAQEMQSYFSRGHTPTVKQGKMCRACSLFDLCLPSLEKLGTVSDYISSNLKSD